jgi:RHS repeat-associated protein
MSGISSKADGKLENRYKFNEGTERTTDLDLNWDETAFRSYDGQLGRFHQIDPLLELAHNWSPYSYVQNNPLLFNDPFGLNTVRTGTVNEGNTATATNSDSTQGSYVVDLNNSNQLLGTGMSGQSEVTVSSSKKIVQK